MNIFYNKFGISALVLAAMCWASAPSFAQHHDDDGDHAEEGEHHEGGHDSDAEIPGSPDEIVAEILARDLMIQDFIETGQLEDVHKPAFEAKALIESLVDSDHAGHDSSLGKKLSAASKRIGASAKLLDKYGDTGDAAKTRSAYKTFGAAIQGIRALYPDVTPDHYWTCSMHPDVWRASSGTCPKGTLKLIEKGEAHEGEHGEHGHSEGDEEEGHH